MTSQRHSGFPGGDQQQGYIPLSELQVGESAGKGSMFMVMLPDSNSHRYAFHAMFESALFADSTAFNAEEDYVVRLSLSVVSGHGVSKKTF